MLDVEGVVKSFVPGTRVLDGVSVHVAEGEITCLLGPSGCGKTTLLRIIAGLEAPDAGRVMFGGSDVTQVPVYQRRFGFMFQDYALFPHMSVAANIAFGLRMGGWDRRRQQARVEEMLDLVNLAGFGRRSVDELSGGEQQRVALARTLALSPQLLLLDEPLANLDRLLREELLDELRTIIRRIGVTTVFVTHDQAEAFALADQVVVMRAGQIEQEGTPQAVYRQPANTFVAGFLGFHNLLSGVVAEDGRSVATPLGRLPLDRAPAPSVISNPYQVLIRPEALLIDEGEQVDSGAVVLEGQTVASTFRGGLYRVKVQLVDTAIPALQFDVTTRGAQQRPRVGEPMRLLLDPGAVVVIGG